MSVTDNEVSPRPATAGVDWAKDFHAVCVVDADGEPLERAVIAHTKTGLARRSRSCGDRPARWVSNGLTGRSWTRCSVPGSPVRDSTVGDQVAAQAVRVGGQQGRPVAASVLGEPCEPTDAGWTPCA